MLIRSLPLRGLVNFLFFSALTVYWYLGSWSPLEIDTGPLPNGFVARAGVAGIITSPVQEPYNPAANDEGLEEEENVIISAPSEGEYLSPDTIPQFKKGSNDMQGTPRGGSAPIPRSGASSTGVAAASPSGSLSWPVNGSLSSRYGPRGRGYHRGIDIAAAYGSPIRAAKGGKVVLAGWYYDYGKTVIIAHPDGTQTLYAHASKLLVSPGDVVEKGQIIANVGRTGRASGPHLHFEVHVGGKRVNPLAYLR